ncbi:MAG: S-layer protein [Crocinitomicaceae bacterium]|nr:S-layer protein [Crocinitomicaceae bacterium]
MKTVISFVAILFAFGFSGISQYTFEKYNSKETTISKEEHLLYELINQYRKQKRLPAIELSKALCHVAKLHAKDLELNLETLTHGWSTCKYKDNLAKTYPCMWEKPSELTSYQFTGYECAHGGEGNYVATAKTSLESWKSSVPHNNVIINKSIWKNTTWKAIGIGIYGGYATIWFGEEKDNDGSPIIEAK